MLVLALLLAGCTAPGAAPADALPPDAGLLAHVETLATFPELRLETEHGTVRVLLYEEWLPQTVEHVRDLVEDGFYDGTLLHRVVDDFVIQGGDPTGTGEGGSGPLGTPDTVPLEIHEGLDFGSGAVGLARWTDDTGDSQYFITEKPAPHLSRPNGTTGQLFGAYALFGQVFEGLDVVRSIAAVETIPHLDRPVQDVVVRRAQVLGPPQADVLGLVQEVRPGFQVAGRSGTLEVPRYVVVDHPATVRFTAKQPTCSLPAEALRVEGPAAPKRDPWTAATGDGCTFEARITFPMPGEYGLASAGTTVAVAVLPWHDAYRPFTGPGDTL